MHNFFKDIPEQLDIWLIQISTKHNKK
jgi:hypothetical protein